MPTVVNKTPEIKVLSENGQYLIDFGRINKGSKKTIEFVIEDAQHSSNRVSCGSCTKAFPIQVGNHVYLKIEYSANSVGTFDKWVKETLTTGEEITFKLKGTTV